MTRTPDNKRTCATDARVAGSTRICREHVQIDLVSNELPPSHPGQFLQLRCADADFAAPQVLAWPRDGFPSPGCEDWRRSEAFLRRPFSIADRWTDDDGATHVAVISRAVGPGTRWLADLRPGDSLNLTGPLGCGFRIPKPAAPLVLVGGGVGIPPLIYLARRLDDLGHRNVTVILGATTADLLPVRLVHEPACDGAPRDCVELAGRSRFPTIVTTDDGSLGMPGLVTDALRRLPQTDAGATVFACGPEGMLRAVARETRGLEWRCQLCLERLMGCGLGTCLSCVVRVRDRARPEGRRWALACSEGPVFERDDVLDYTSEQGA
jgi:dihydroorotate dehydrogenase electron transfer subunit